MPNLEATGRRPSALSQWGRVYLHSNEVNLMDIDWGWVRFYPKERSNNLILYADEKNVISFDKLMVKRAQLFQAKDILLHTDPKNLIGVWFIFINGEEGKDVEEKGVWIYEQTLKEDIWRFKDTQEYINEKFGQKTIWWNIKSGAQYYTAKEFQKKIGDALDTTFRKKRQLSGKASKNRDFLIKVRFKEAPTESAQVKMLANLVAFNLNQFVSTGNGEVVITGIERCKEG